MGDAVAKATCGSVTRPNRKPSRWFISILSSQTLRVAVCCEYAFTI
jgi:hypothetical protein